jgi:hypothetical protein
MATSSRVVKIYPRYDFLLKLVEDEMGLAEKVSIFSTNKMPNLFRFCLLKLTRNPICFHWVSCKLRKNG